jgi:2,3-bisphosphoglycerate-dependent phosphoglycerate mutase/probable phosphoglycerate mutase
MAPPGGESRLEVSERASSVVDELDSGGHEAALLVSHGGLIVGLTGRLLGIDPDRWGALIGVANCHWVALHRVAGRWLLHTYNGGLGGIVLAPRDEEIVDD